ncbi:MAG TPA: hypothetical protein VHU23_03845 [Rhizomicrobium sp.]|jgi:hypothetical protein|nr:hypothetical protein [Rhizomicrobium sp.]
MDEITAYDIALALEDEVKRLAGEINKLRSRQLLVTDDNGNDLTSKRDEELCERARKFEGLLRDFRAPK